VKLPDLYLGAIALEQNNWSDPLIPLPPYQPLTGYREEMITDLEDLMRFEEQLNQGIRQDLSQYDKMRLVRAAKSMTNVYFVLATESLLIKIGRAKNVRKRLMALQTQSPCELKLLTSMRAHQAIEPYLHKQLADSRAHGEWFRADDRVLSVVDGAIDGGIRGALAALKS